MSAEPAARDRVAAAIGHVPLATDPGPHLVVRDVLADAYYERLLDSLPAAEDFRYGDRFKQDFEPLTATTSTETIRSIWREFEREVVDGLLVPQLIARFAAPIRRYYAWHFGSLGDEAAALPLSSRGGRLMLRRPGYRLKPHCDTQIAVLTGLLYLARPGDDASFGTQLYRVDRPVQPPSMKTFYPEEFGCTCELAAIVPFTPNTLLAFANGVLAHAAAIPADAAQPERYAYQFYVAPNERALAAIASRLEPEARARWKGLQG